MQGELSLSLSALCEAARLNPQHSGLAFEVARAALIARDGVTAARFAEQSLALTPPDRRSREVWADALAWQGNVEASRAAWLGIHKLTTPSDKTYSNLALGAALEARTAAKAGDYATAERYLRRSLAFDPDNAGTTTQLARVLFMAGHHAVAARWVERALALDATDPERHVLAGEIQNKLSNAAAATGHYSRALELDPQNAIAKLRLRAQNP
jgi:tetratricopeptide (TPR) repeat protein